MAVVSGGVENLSGDIDTELTDMDAGAGFLDGVEASDQAGTN
jgi:hypothetical protein